MKQLVLLLSPALLIAGCSSLPEAYRDEPTVHIQVDAPASAAHALERCETVAAALNAALKNDSRILSRQRDLQLEEAGSSLLGRLRSPEISMGGDWGNGNTTGNSTKITNRDDNQSETSIENRYDVYPNFVDSNPTEYGSSSSSSNVQSDRERDEWSSFDDSSWMLGLSLYPPNPWVLRAELAQAKADTHLARTRLREAQIELLEDVALKSAELISRNREIQLLEQLTTDCQPAVNNAPRLGVKDQADIMRRSLSIQSDLSRAKRQLNSLTSELESKLGLAIKAEHFSADWSWLPADDTQTLQRLIDNAATLRPDVAGTYWQAAKIQASYNELRGEAIPWFRKLEVGYSANERDAQGGYNGEIYRSTSGSDYSASSQEYSSYTRYNESTSYENSSAYETETNRSTDHRESDEWQVTASIEIPIFLWMSGDSSKMKHAAESAWNHVDQARRSAENDLRNKISALRNAQNEIATFETDVLPASQSLTKKIGKLLNNGSLSPEDRIRLAEQICDLEREQLDLNLNSLKARIRLWAACGAPRTED